MSLEHTEVVWEQPRAQDPVHWNRAGSPGRALQLGDFMDFLAPLLLGEQLGSSGSLAAMADASQGTLGFRVSLLPPQREGSLFCFCLQGLCCAVTVFPFAMHRGGKCVCILSAGWAAPLGGHTP